MGVDLRMEPYATASQRERPESRIMDELYFPDVDKLCDRLGLSWYDFYATVDEEGRLPHEAALRLVPAENYLATEIETDAGRPAAMN